ncbi:MAG: ATP-binding protein, partial [Candidatus Obscuribacter sp.]|nr:ATP-binding protein [Candidatus Obscuribacter sp.]
HIQNLRVLFEHAKARPCVLFLDELDSLGKLRDDKHELGELKRVVVSLLQNIDALHNETVLLSATNHEHLLDSAIWRRFCFQVKVDKPDEHSRESMAASFLGSFATPQNIRVCSQLPGWSSR